MTFGYSAWRRIRIAPVHQDHVVRGRLPDEYAVAREILVRERDKLLTRPVGHTRARRAIWHAREELSKALGLNTPELSAYLVKMNSRLIAQAPLEYLHEVGRAFAAYWFPASGPLAAMASLLFAGCGPCCTSRSWRLVSCK
jgi:hypothetical protein